LKNLSIAFPKKTEEEKLKIAKKFYLNFTDTFIETIKLLSAGKNFVNQRVVADYSIFQKIFEDGKKCQIHTGHNFNWEIQSFGLVLNIRQKLLAVYLPLENKVFDRIFLKLRRKFGTALLPATDMRNAILPYRSEQYAIGLIADQSPANPTAGYWVNFFGRPTVFLKAPENGARIANLPVVFSHMTKIKRGYYHFHFEMGQENPAALKKGDLTKRYARFLERVMTEHPEMWLWSHRRWKWEWKEEYGKVIE